MMPIIDVVLLISLFGFVFYGLFFGLIRSFGSLVGVLAGAVLASRFYLPMYSWIQEIFFGRTNLGKVIVFIVIFTLVNRLVGLGFYLIEKIFKVLTIIPFLKTFNRLGGAVLGFITGGFFIGLILYVINKYAFIEHWVGRWLVDSSLAPFFLKFANFLLPLLPEMLKKLQSLI
ncbi:CvpA family protein [Patescibacteria group bacterium]